jgi:hypothetical protein
LGFANDQWIAWFMTEFWQAGHAGKQRNLPEIGLKSRSIIKFILLLF